MLIQLDTTSNVEPETASTLPIHASDKFFSKLLLKEPLAPSRAMYYGRVQSSIPFGWESQPGTPKNAGPSATETNPNDIILTLTPPPSLYGSPSSSSMSSSSSGSPKSPSDIKLLKSGKGHITSYFSPHCIAPRLKGSSLRMAQTGSSSSCSSSLSSLSPSSSWSGPGMSSSALASRVPRERHRRYSLRSRLQSELTEHNFTDHYYENIDHGNFVSARKRTLGNKLKGGCFATTTLKKAVLAIVGRRSGHRDT